MRRVESWCLCLALVAAPMAMAQAPADAAGVASAPRSARLVAEGSTAAVGGLLVPLVTYGGLTALQSFVGFFAGFVSATVVGAVLAPIAVVVASQLAGGQANAGRAILGALVGLLAGALLGLPLATMPGPGYLVGLALFWALPSLGTLLAVEWGQAVPSATGLTVARF